MNASVVAVNGRLVSAATVNGLTQIDAAAAGLVWLVLATAAMIAAARRMPWAVPVLILLAATDLGRWGYSFAFAEPGVTLEVLRTQALAPPGRPTGEYVLRPTQMPDGNLPVMRGWRLADGYLALSPKVEFDPLVAAERDLSGARWIWDGARWQAVAAPLPPARLVTAARLERNPVRHLRSVDARSTALVETEVGPLQGPSGTAVLASDRSGRMVVDTRTESRQLLVVARRYHQGWQAVQGCAGPVLRIYGVWLGCVIEAGTERVELRFAPRSFTAGRLASLLSVGVWCVALVFVERARRRRRAPAQVRDARA